MPKSIAKGIKIKQRIGLLHGRPEFAALFSPVRLAERSPLIGADELQQIGGKVNLYMWNGLLDLQVDAVSTSFAPPDFSFFTGVSTKDWEGHALNHKPLLWWRTPSEPDFTQLLGRLFFPAGSSHATSEGYAFLCALLKVSRPVADSICYSSRPKDIFCIKWEEPVPGGILDMLFSWHCNGKLHMAALEIKFGADVNNPFEEYAVLTEKAEKRCHIVLGCHLNQKQAAEKHGWSFAYWFDLLREWERLLFAMECQSDPDNIRLRTSLWRKVGEYA